MNAFPTLSFAIVMATVSACATTATPTLDETIAAGATLLPPNSADVIGEDGVTHVSVDGDWAVYYAPERRKVAAVSGKAPQILGWRVDDDGRFCEDFVSRNGAEVCGADIARVVDADGVVTEWSEGRPLDYAYRMERGNPRGL